jgi:hypothetical protein
MPAFAVSSPRSTPRLARSSGLGHRQSLARRRRPRPPGGQPVRELRPRALDARTGELKWHCQFTPHDVEDRDATEPNVLVDRVYKGKPSKLLLHADCNGYFYVLDRTNGAVLLAKPFLRRVDWASGIGADGRPVVTDSHGSRPTPPTGRRPPSHRPRACTLSWPWKSASASPPGIRIKPGRR